MNAHKAMLLAFTGPSHMISALSQDYPRFAFVYGVVRGNDASSFVCPTISSALEAIQIHSRAPSGKTNGLDHCQRSRTSVRAF